MRVLGEVRMVAPSASAGLAARVLATSAGEHADPSPMLASLLAERGRQEEEISHLRQELAAQSFALLELRCAAQQEAIEEARQIRDRTLRAFGRTWGLADARGAFPESSRMHAAASNPRDLPCPALLTEGVRVAHLVCIDMAHLVCIDMDREAPRRWGSARAGRGRRGGRQRRGAGPQPWYQRSVQPTLEWPLWGRKPASG